MNKTPSIHHRYKLHGETLPADLHDWDGRCRCGKPAVYVRVLDRFIHEDGSANRQCWLEQLRGTA